MAGKIYWKNVKKSDNVTLKNHQFFVRGKLVYWSGWESEFAQKKLMEMANR